MACLQSFQELLSLATFLRVHSKSKGVSYLSWQNKYPNLKTACHIGLKFFLWTKLLENVLLAKYLISVAAALSAGSPKASKLKKSLGTLNGKNAFFKKFPLKHRRKNGSWMK